MFIVFMGIIGYGRELSLGNPFHRLDAIADQQLIFIANEFIEGALHRFTVENEFDGLIPIHIERTLIGNQIGLAEIKPNVGEEMTPGDSTLVDMQNVPLIVVKMRPFLGKQGDVIGFATLNIFHVFIRGEIELLPIDEHREVRMKVCCHDRRHENDSN